ncbi:hypothetical protein AB0C69_16385, partial [Actinomadura sp. NPDC048032]
GPCGSYTDWWNRGGGGAPKWETFHLAELRQILPRDEGDGMRYCVRMVEQKFDRPVRSRSPGRRHGGDHGHTGARRLRALRAAA